MKAFRLEAKWLACLLAAVALPALGALDAKLAQQGTKASTARQN
jgi:hypothetical protein